jgi:hypothetical protein
MKAEIRLLRTELGYLTIDDPEKITAIKLQSGDPLTWQWRIYLPPGRKYRIRCASGFFLDLDNRAAMANLDLQRSMREAGVFPDPLPSTRDYWLDKVLESAVVADIGPDHPQGELILTARLVKVIDEWRLQLDPGGEAPIHQPNGDWLSDDRSRPGGSSDVPLTEQTTYTADTRVVLAHVRRNVVTVSGPRSWTVRPSVGDADSFIVWLEPEPASESDPK